jgi:hypothetical protein
VNALILVSDSTVPFEQESYFFKGGQSLGRRRSESAVSMISTKQRVHMAAMKGTLKRLVGDKAFGFILAGDGNEYFFSQLGVRSDALR